MLSLVLALALVVLVATDALGKDPTAAALDALGGRADAPEAEEKR